MKLYKIIICCLSIILLYPTQNNAKKYTGGYTPHVLDICIYLQTPNSKEEKLAKKGEFGAITHELIYTIKQNEAAIVSAPLIRALIELYKKIENKHLNYKIKVDLASLFNLEIRDILTAINYRAS